MRRLMIITYRFPPMNAIASRRWAEMIPTLNKEYEIYVFTMNSSGDLPCPLPKKKIRRVGMQENYEVEGEYKTSFIHKLLNKFTNEIQAFDSTWISWFWKFRHHLKDYFDSVNPDIVLTTVGPYSTALFAKYLQIKRKKFYWICDIRDPAYLYQKYLKNYFQKLCDKHIERWLLKTADCLTATVGDTTIAKLELLHNKKVYQIFNGFPEKKYLCSNATEKTLLYYAGRIYPHREESFILLLESLKNRSDIELNVNLLGQQERIERINKITSGYQNVNILPPATAFTVYETACNCDILILLENIKPKDSIDLGVLPGKLFEYLPFSAPILAICSKKAHIASILNKTNKGIATKSIDEISNFINGSYKEYIGNTKEIALYSRAHQADRFLKILNREFN